ncbi:MAG: glycogen debranching enzyme GlgX, partial [Pseudomonadota bacterium]
MSAVKLSGGHAASLGATLTADGANFAVFSDHATAMTLCLFDETGETRIDLPEQQNGVWHGHVSGIAAGQHYGFRAHGHYKPDQGHRFNPNKLLIDPYAKALSGHPTWDDAVYGYTRGAINGDLTFDDRDSAPFVPKSIVLESRRRPANHPRNPWEKTIIYESHPKGLTQLMEGLDTAGTLAALASDRVIDHLKSLGIVPIGFGHRLAILAAP